MIGQCDVEVYMHLAPPSLPVGIDARLDSGSACDVLNPGYGNPCLANFDDPRVLKRRDYRRAIGDQLGSEMLGGAPGAPVREHLQVPNNWLCRCWQTNAFFPKSINCCEHCTSIQCFGTVVTGKSTKKFGLGLARTNYSGDGALWSLHSSKRWQQTCGDRAPCGNFLQPKPPLIGCGP